MLYLYLHLRTYGELASDPEGASFVSLESAREEAIVAAREIMAERVLKGQPADHSQFEIADEAGTTVLVVPFEDAIRPLSR